MQSLGKLLWFSPSLSKKDKFLYRAIKTITGEKPGNLEIYKLALRHSSAQIMGGEKSHNERLEYLGDAILGAVIAHFLFKKFPLRDEGFLTEIRSRIVNGEFLNQLARKIGLQNIMEFDVRQKGVLTHKSMLGDALEAMVGAYFLDKGFSKTQKFIQEKLINIHIDLDLVVLADHNYKSRLIEWAQKEVRTLRFEIIQEEGRSHLKEFMAQIYLDNQPLTTGIGFSKKKAEQNAAMKALELLKIEAPE